MEPSTAPAHRPRTSATPVGPATITGETAIPSALRDGDEVVLQHLESPVGPLVRVAYRRADRVLRGPIAMTPDEAAALAEAIAVSITSSA
jgi:hypothetical protein